MKFDLVALAVVASASTLTPPVLPLIVRNPYLSTWLADARRPPWESWPMFWTGRHVGLSVMASVPGGKVFPLLGRPQDSLPIDLRYELSYPHYLGAVFDASTTNLTYRINGPKDEHVRLTLSFLSPITPSSTMRQSIPSAYLFVHVDGDLDLDVYVDVNGQWVSGHSSSRVTWGLSRLGHGASSSAIKTWKIARTEQLLFTEFQDQSEWGTLFFSAPLDVTHRSGPASRLRQLFAERGCLDDQVEGESGRINEGDPVVAFAKSFKLRERKVDHVLFTLALLQDPVVQFASANGLVHMQPLWASYFPSAGALISYHYHDHATASSLAHNYSATLARDAHKHGSHEYADIVALSARQTMGATQFAGTSENPILFLKEISSDGNLQTVDVIFPAFPFFLYTNPHWLAYLLEPLLEHQLNGQYPNEYSMHDLGSHYPNATGHANGRDEYMPVEECGNMLIMGLALANALRHETGPALASAAVVRLQTGGRPWQNHGPGADIDSAVMTRTAHDWLARSYKLWKQWTGFLVRESLIPATQLSTDDFAGWLANQTNLALKGIIGIRAMSEIADILGNDKEAVHYRDISDRYIAKWQEYAISTDRTHAKLAYTWYGSWTTIYNLYADSLLCFHTDFTSSGRPPFVPDSIYQMQSDWYLAVLQRYGLPLDSRHLYAKSDWEFFAAAVTGIKTRTAMLSSIARWVNETSTDRPLTDLYNTEGHGGFPNPRFFARPVVGGHFAPLALERACGGKAVEALRFLDKREPAEVHVEMSLRADLESFGKGGEVESVRLDL